jgi:hypothetical protein
MFNFVLNFAVLEFIFYRLPHNSFLLSLDKRKGEGGAADILYIYI